MGPCRPAGAAQVVMNNKLFRITKEFIHHFPYSAVGVAAALGMILGFEKMGVAGDPDVVFHIMHPAHIFLSALVTTALFWKYEKQLIKTVLVGLLGSIPVCVLSDVFIPYIGGALLGTPIEFHLCAIEEPWLVYPAGVVGVVLGIFLLNWVEKGTEISHLLHVMISSLASLFYLVSFDVPLWLTSTWAAFVITLLAVWLPCCLSDIIFPLALVKNGHSPCCGHHPHEF